MRTTLLDHVSAACAAEAETGDGARHVIRVDDDDPDEDPDEEDEEEEETWQVSAERRSETLR